MLNFTVRLESGLLELKPTPQENLPKSSTPDGAERTQVVPFPRQIATRLTLASTADLRFHLSSLLQQILAKNTYDGFKRLHRRHYKRVQQLITPRAKSLKKTFRQGKLISHLRPREFRAVPAGAVRGLLPGSAPGADRLLPPQPGRGVHELTNKTRAKSTTC